ncbi:MAG: hypothetical protein K2M19_09080 [Muribaculaceae bacterium]|nr:hypothetical protein [Muribaculaceae bacterium]
MTGSKSNIGDGAGNSPLVPDTIAVREAARWLARMAAIDGVVSPSERRILKEFAEAFGIAPNSLFRMAHAIANRVEVPEVESVSPAEMKGRMFEDFVVRLTADSARFTRIHWTGDKCVDGIYALENLLPDLHLRHRLDAGVVEYYVECKYRSSLPDGTLDLTSQLGRYRRMSSAKDNCELFIAVGLGGLPSAPEQFYVIPSRMIKRDYVVRLGNFAKCLCPPTPEGFHDYINHYFTKRVLNNHLR